MAEAPHYVSVTPLARGGMGSVELVLRREGAFRRLYARKRPLRIPDQEKALNTHFLREARVAGLLRHPNAVSVLDVGEDERGPYLVMDFVEGVSLATLIGHFRASEELIPMQVCLRLGKQIADGLHAAHELRDHAGESVSLVHRDVSPQNVLLDFEGIAQVTDFGLAKSLGAGMAKSSSDALKGKLGYMSPEQLRFEAIDRRADLWALGVVLYELMVGERLYVSRGDGIEHVARQILDDPPPDVGVERDDVPPAATELLFDLLAKDRDARPATAAEVSRRLGAILREVEHEDGVIELADFVEMHFAEVREQARTDRAAQIKLAEAHASRIERGAERSGGAARWWVGAAALLALAWVGGYAWWTASSGAEAPATVERTASASSAATPLETVAGEAEPTPSPESNPSRIDVAGGRAVEEPTVIGAHTEGDERAVIDARTVMGEGSVVDEGTVLDDETANARTVNEARSAPTSDSVTERDSAGRAATPAASPPRSAEPSRRPPRDPAGRLWDWP